MREELLCRFVAQLADEGLSPNTIKPYLSAVRHLQVSMSLPDPRIGDMARLEQVLKGSKREFAKRGPGQRLPVKIARSVNFPRDAPEAKDSVADC